MRAVGGAVVHHQHPYPRQGGRRFGGQAGGRREGHGDGKGGALAEGALRLDAPAHQVDQTLDDGQAQAAAPVAAVVEASAWVKAPKTASVARGRCPCPCPAQRTARSPGCHPCRHHHPRRARACTHRGGTRAQVSSRCTSPCSVNLTALPSKFSSTWRRRWGSPRTQAGTSGATSQVSSSPLVWARTASTSAHFRPALPGRSP